MVWLNPAAWIGLVALAVPVLIHILVQRRAERLAFPSLRFLQQTRLASIRRHVLEDAVLLAIRAAILVAAVAALAGPLLVTPFRREGWNARVAQAIVIDEAARASQSGERGAGTVAPQPRPVFSHTFETKSLSDGIHRARAWLDAAPPARRELVIISPFALGSVSASDLALVPPPIGIRFERRGTLPGVRTVAGGAVLSLERDPSALREPQGRPEQSRGAAGSGSARAASRAEGFSRAVDPRPSVLRQTVELNGAATTVREAAAATNDRFPIDIVCSADARRAADAAISAVRAQRIWAVADNRHARLALIGTSDDMPELADARVVSKAWAADALARIARDRALQAEASNVANGLSDRRFSTPPWTTVAVASDGRPLAVGAELASGLVVVSGAEASSLAIPLLIRAMADGIAVFPDLRAAEVLPIPDAQLQAWTRPPGPLAVPRIDQIEQDDRRSLWVLVVGLLALEMWVRRARAAAALGADEEQARVA